MNNNEDIRHFLIIKKKRILFETFDPINGSSLVREISLENYFKHNFLSLIEEFLDKNVFDIEKKLKNFIKKIYIIIESDSFFKVESSIKNNPNGINFNHDQLKESLIDIKNEFEKNSQRYEIIHMIINRYTVNGVDYETLPENVDGDDLVIQLKFICLENKIVDNLTRIFSKYEISINQIISYEYLKSLNNFSSKNITKIAYDTIDGHNENEVFIVKKTFKKQGFFEKFFNFFN